MRTIWTTKSRSSPIFWLYHLFSSAVMSIDLPIITLHWFLRFSLISHPENHLKFIHMVSDHNSRSSIMNLNTFSFSGVILHVLNLPKNNKYSSSRSIDPFMITAVLHSSGTFMSGKIMILRKNRDVINIFNCSTTSFYGKGYYYHSQMSRINAGP